MIDIITWLIVLILGLFAALLIAYPLRFLWKQLFKIILSVTALILINLIGYPFGFHIGINLLTIFFCTLLGVPGITTLILFELIFKSF